MTSRVLPGAQIAARWQVNQLIGASVLGEVYEVLEITSGRVYALKLFAPELTRAGALWADYQTIARRASSLPFDAIAKVHDFGADQQLGSAFSVGERILWPSLDQQVRQKGPLPAERVAALLELLAPALDAAHSSGIVHRGLSPTNIFCANEGGGVRVSDFGAWLLRRAVPSPPGWAGPPGYIGPDAVDHAAPAHPRMDVYALGAVVFFAMTGQSPFKAMQARPLDYGVLWNELILPLPPPSQRARELGVSLPAELDHWFSHTLSPHPKARFTTVGEAARAYAERAGSRIRAIAGPPTAAKAATGRSAPMKTMVGGFGVGVPAPPGVPAVQPSADASRATPALAARKQTMMGMGTESVQRPLPKLPERPVVPPLPQGSHPTHPGLGAGGKPEQQRVDAAAASAPLQPKRGLGGTMVIDGGGGTTRVGPTLSDSAEPRRVGPTLSDGGGPLAARGISPTAPTEPAAPVLHIPGPHGALGSPVSAYAPTDPATPPLISGSSYRPPAPSASDSGPVALVSARPLAYMADLPRPAPVAERAAAEPAAAAASTAQSPGSVAVSRSASAASKTNLVLPLAIAGGLLFVTLIAIGVWFAVPRLDPAALPSPSAAASPESPAAAASGPAPAPAREVAAAPAAAQSVARAAESAPPAESAAARETTAADAMVKFQCQPGCETIDCDGTNVESIGGARLAAGTHRCRARKAGYLDRTDEIVVKAGVDQTHVFRLRPQPAEARPERPGTSSGRPAAAKGEKKKPCGTFINPCK